MQAGQEFSSNFVKPNRAVGRVFIHCSASDNPKHDNVKTIDSWHRNRGFNGIGYHYYIDKLGKLHIGRDINRVPAAQAGNNRGTIAICVGGLDHFTLAQMNTLLDLCTEINIAYENRVTFHGHCEVSNKSCPVFDYREVLALDNKGNLFGAS